MMSNYQLGGCHVLDIGLPSEIVQAVSTQSMDAYPLLPGKKKDMFLSCGKLQKFAEQDYQNALQQMQYMRGLGFHKVSTDHFKEALEQGMAFQFTYTYLY
jgi:hypothetical protein